MRAVLGLILCVTFVSAQFNPHYEDGRNTIAHLFEWKWPDIAAECENWLSARGFAGVQISPPSENSIVSGRPFWERYQPLSYILTTRSGNETTLADMITRCNNVGIRIYVDLVLNQMATSSGNGTGGNTADPDTKSYPAVSYSSENFHETCDMDFTDADSIRVCELSGASAGLSIPALKDLNQTQSYVQGKIRDYMNHLISLGVAGFRVDAATFIYPADLSAIFASVNDLSTDFFPAGSRAVYYSEVSDTSAIPVSNTEYTGFGRVLEFKYGQQLATLFRGNSSLKNLVNWGTPLGLLDGSLVMAFVENHDTERENTDYLNYKEPKPYKAAIAFMLAHSYDGLTKITSSFKFNVTDDPAPANSDEEIISPGFNADGSCTNGWVCQHRWSPIVNMVEFRNVVAGTSVTKWWTGGGTNQIAFSRGSKGLFAATVSGDINASIATDLPNGIYCDVISGNYEFGLCTGKTVVVLLGQAHVQLSSSDAEAALAIHVNARI